MLKVKVKGVRGGGTGGTALGMDTRETLTLPNIRQVPEESKRSDLNNHLSPDNIQNIPIGRDPQIPSPTPIPPNYLKTISNLDKNILSTAYNREKYSEYFLVIGLEKSLKLNSSTQNITWNPCPHEICESLPIYAPVLLDHYPNTQYNDLPIPPQTQDFCYPLGIKLCLYTSYTSPPRPECSLIILTDSEGNKFYITALHFYEEWSSEEFLREYGHPLTRGSHPYSNN